MNLMTKRIVTLLINALLATLAAAQSAHHQLNPTPELLRQSESRMWENMRKAFTVDELHAFIRTHANSEYVPAALTRLGRSEQRDINTLQHVLGILAAQAPSTELSQKMGIADAQQLKDELQNYLKIRQVALLDIQARHRTLTGNEIEMGLAKTELFGVVKGDVPSPMFAAPMHTFGYIIKDTMLDGNVFTQKGSNASMTTIQPEMVKVAAGSFTTWRVERKADWFVNETGNSGTFKLIGWYSPMLRRYVKSEEISHNAAGKVVRHERHELLKTD